MSAVLPARLKRLFKAMDDFLPIRDRRRLRGIWSSFNGTTSLPYELSNKPSTNTIVRSPLTIVVDGPDGNRPAARGPISFGADVFVAVLSDGNAQPFLVRPGERGT